VIVEEDRASSCIQGSFVLGIRKNFILERVMKCWKRLPREVSESASWEVFEGRVDIK